MAADAADFRAMGGRARVVVVAAPPTLLDVARRRLRELEARWTRFDAESELMRLNARPGVPVVVSDETFLLVERALKGWEATGGRFDPTVLDAVAAAGYDRSFEQIREGTTTHEDAVVPGCEGIRLDPVVRAVSLPRGVRIDPGGIGKGLAADLVVAELVDAGAGGALVELGGDLRVEGDPPNAGGWLIAVEDPHEPEGEVARLTLAEGGVATSSTTWRHWRDARGHIAHHLVDPRTGRVGGAGLASATVVAAEAWWAEVYAKAAFVAGTEAAPLLRAAGLSGVLVADDGSVEAVGEGCEEAA